MSRKPCASCSPSLSSSWIPAEEGTAKWLQEDKVVRDFFRDRPGFYVRVPVPEWASQVWCSLPLTVSYQPPAPPARRAYTGEDRGWDIQRVVGVSASSMMMVLKAPMPYMDDDGQVYPPHVHALHKDGSQVFTLPFVIPECEFATALRISEERSVSSWRLVYVLDNLDDYLPCRPLKGTVCLTSAEAIAGRFDPSTPLLLYCAGRSCDASHKMAKALVLRHGFEVAAVFSGGMEDVRERLCLGGLRDKVRERGTGEDRRWFNEIVSNRPAGRHRHKSAPVPQEFVFSMSRSSKSFHVVGVIGCPLFESAEAQGNRWVQEHGGSLEAVGLSRPKFKQWLKDQHAQGTVPESHTTCPVVWIDGEFVDSLSKKFSPSRKK